MAEARVLAIELVLDERLMATCCCMLCTAFFFFFFFFLLAVRVVLSCQNFGPNLDDLQGPLRENKSPHVT